MRTLSETLEAGQQASSIDALVKIYLSYGETNYTYLRDRIIGIDETEDGPLQSCDVVLDNSDGEFTELDLRGYQAVLSFGVDDEYSDCAPMWVVTPGGQRFDSTPGRLTCTLSLIGICNLLQSDKASDNYIAKMYKKGVATETVIHGGEGGYLKDKILNQFTPSDVGRVVWNTTDNTFATITDWNCAWVLTLDTEIMEEGELYQIVSAGFDATPKTLIRQILGDTGVTMLSVYNHCQKYDVVFDSEDDLIDSYRPKDHFRIYRGSDRYSAIERLLAYTECVWRSENDGKIHIFVPTTSGETYDYEYSLESGHTFFAKALRNRLTVPNCVEVKSRPTDRFNVQGVGYDMDSYNILPMIDYIWASVDTTEEAIAVAEAIVGKFKMWCQAGSADVPLNVGAEVYDYIKVTDERESDYRAGNIGVLRRHYTAGKNEWRMTFTFGNWQNARKALGLLSVTADTLEESFVSRYVSDLYAYYFNDQETGVAISAFRGIDIFGDSMALRTYESWDDYVNGVNGKCYVGAEGIIIGNKIAATERLKIPVGEDLYEEEPEE